MLRTFYKHYPWLVEDLRNCNHSQFCRDPNPYHLEGDVWSHTMLVFNQADSKLFQAVAICHDIGKLHTRYFNYKTSRTSFYGHAGVSAFMSIDILRNLGFSDQLITQAFKIIAAHMEVHQLTSEQLISKYPYECNFLYQLQKFGRFDNEGRISDKSEEHDPLFWNYQDPRLKWAPTIDSKPEKTVEVMVGLPCSGKSSYLAKMAPQDILSRDEHVMLLGGGRDYNRAWQSVDHKEVDRSFNLEKKNMLQTNNKVYIDCTNLSLKSRKSVLIGFEKWHKKAVIFLTPWDVIQERNINRIGKYIDNDVYLKMMNSFSLPSYEQFDEIEWKF